MLQSWTPFRGIIAGGAVVLLAASVAAGAAPARVRDVPAETVIRVELEDKLSSRSAARGERFTAMLDEEDRSGLPEGTTFQGVVTEVRRATKEQPGVLDMRFQRAILPGGTAVAMSGTLGSLKDDDVSRTENGRLVSRHRKKKFETKWVGYGAGAGAVLSTVFGGNFLKGALLGALGGAAYAYLNKDKDGKKPHDVELSRGTEFGIRLTRRLSFSDRPSYKYAAR